MIGQDPRTDALNSRRKCSAPTAPNAATARHSSRRRIFATRPRAVSGTIFRRRISDSSRGRNDTYHWNSETFCLAAAERYHDYFINIISNPNPAHAKWSAYASIYWSDSNADGRQDSSEVCRVSGKVDSVRLPKQAYYVYRVMQNDRAGPPHHRPLELSDRTP